MGWMSESATLVAEFPVCTQGPYRYGRALSRQYLDTLLVERALAQGVVVLQPGQGSRNSRRPRSLSMRRGFRSIGPAHVARRRRHRCARVMATRSWPPTSPAPCRRRQRPSDLLAFKAVFKDTRLEEGLLPVISLPGGYGGMVVADQGQTTLACCLRRDTLSACRAMHRGLAAGEAVEAFLRESCGGVREALQGARRVGAWLSVGPLWPGAHPAAGGAIFRVGNAAGESHPLIGEGISMALQSATLLAHELTRHSPAVASRSAPELQRRYARAWQQAFSQRLQVAALYAHVAMRPYLATPALGITARWPGLLGHAARLAGKARGRTQHEHSRNAPGPADQGPLTDTRAAGLPKRSCRRWALIHCR